MKYFKGLSFYIVLFVIILVVLSFYQTQDNPVDMDYSDLLKGIREKNVSTIQLEGDKATVTFIKNPYPEKTDSGKFVVYIPDMSSFMELVHEPMMNN